MRVHAAWRQRRARDRTRVLAVASAAASRMPPPLCPLPHSTFGVSCFNFWAIPTVFSCASLGLLAALGVFSSHPAASPLILRSIEHGCNAAGAAGLAGYASRRRRQLRQLEGLPEGPLSDWCTYFWCSSLTVCTVL